MGKSRKLAVIAGITASIGAAVLGLVGMPAHADGGAGQLLSINLNTGACGGSYQQESWGSHGVYVCTSGGIGNAAPIGQRSVNAGTWRCSNGGDCVSTDVQGNVPASAASIDPLLRTASVNATVQGCAISVRFDATGRLTPTHNLYEWSGGGITPISVSANAGANRSARLTGMVCGTSVNGDGSLFHYAGVGVWQMPAVM